MTRRDPRLQPHFALRQIEAPDPNERLYDEDILFAQLDICEAQQKPLALFYERAAMSACEKATDLRFMTQTLEILFDGFGYGIQEIKLPIAPIQQGLFLKYYDEDGILTELDEYQLDRYSFVARLRPAIDQCWPIPQRNRAGSVILRVIAGFGLLDGDNSAGSANSGSIETADIPADIQMAVLLTAKDWWTGRGLGPAIGDIKSETIGDYSYTLADKSSTSGQAIPPGALSLLDPYIRKDV